MYIHAYITYIHMHIYKHSYIHRYICIGAVICIYYQIHCGDNQSNSTLLARTHTHTHTHIHSHTHIYICMYIYSIYKYMYCEFIVNIL